MTKKQFAKGICFLLLSGCIEEDIKRLQTNQSFEAEEAYLISSLLDEQLYQIWQPFSFFSDSESVASIPGCPEVTVDATENTVTLAYQSSVCEDDSGTRSGSLILSYVFLPQPQGYRLHVAYVDYTFDGNRITGTRDLTIAAQNRDTRVLSDTGSSILIQFENQSSSRVNFNFLHELSISSAQVRQGKSTGTGTGRNWAGREVSWEVSVPKVFPLDCEGRSRPRPKEGQETWTVTRGAAAAVVHGLTFFSTPECTTHTILRLDEGVEIKKAP